MALVVFVYTVVEAVTTVSQAGTVTWFNKVEIVRLN
jgi:hypothetical protein